MILTGAPTYTIDVPGLGDVTYVRGEDVPQAHVNEVPEADRSLFEQPRAEYDAPAPDADDEADAPDGDSSDDS